MRIGNAPEVGDPEMQALQQARLLALGMRTMTLPLGRGALTLGESAGPLAPSLPQYTFSWGRVRGLVPTLSNHDGYIMQKPQGSCHHSLLGPNFVPGWSPS